MRLLESPEESVFRLNLFCFHANRQRCFFMRLTVYWSKVGYFLKEVNHERRSVVSQRFHIRAA